MNVYRILALVLGIVMAAAGFALAAWGYVKRDALAERLATQPCCAEQVEACCPDAANDEECCAQPADPADTHKEERNGN